jgi:hypothetical protein
MSDLGLAGYTAIYGATVGYGCAVVLTAQGRANMALRAFAVGMAFATLMLFEA